MDKKDISVELWREYQYDDYVVRIERPVDLYISESGSHRVVDQLGVTHWVPGKFRTLRWYAPEEPVSF